MIPNKNKHVLIIEPEVFFVAISNIFLEITAIKIKLPEIAILINDNNITNQRYFLLH